MGVLNVTPDSFSDGGRDAGPEAAAERGLALLEAGADLLDVGGESTRPGADPVEPDEERARVLPVVEALLRARPEARISVDTRRASVARAALEAGASMVNDVSAFGGEGMPELVAEAGCPVVLMHMRGTPRTMQAHTAYDDLLGEIVDELAAAVAKARAAGVRGDRILVDPGIGFGKSFTGNELILRQLQTFRSVGQPVAIGASRKRFIGARTGVEEPARRLAGSLAAAVAAALGGAAVVRAHDVAATREALAVADAIAGRPATGDAGGAAREGASRRR
jgi:dihydropteroate synthase